MTSTLATQPTPRRYKCELRVGPLSTSERDFTAESSPMIPRPRRRGSLIDEVLCFLGCAYTNLAKPELFSLSLVSLEGNEHYVETQFGARCAEGQLERASEFERDHVFDQWGLPEFERSGAFKGRHGVSTLKWLTGLVPKSRRLRVQVAFDHPLRYRLFRRALQLAGHRNRDDIEIVPLDLSSLAQSCEGELAAERCYHLLVDRRIRRHHALADALALRAAYLSITRTSEQLTPVLLSVEFRRLVALVETRIGDPFGFDTEGLLRRWLTVEEPALDGNRPLDLITQPGGLDRLEEFLATTWRVCGVQVECRTISLDKSALSVPPRKPL